VIGVRINLASVLVDDQAKALRFYTEVLGFKEKNNVPLGEHSWITVVSPDDPDGTELVLEPDEHPAVKPFKSALVADERLRGLGVHFTQEPAEMGPVTTAVLDDTCGNLIQIAHLNA
jgi:catechol 2,3-dioxygenase-like lactoylglutathione lyase family enzyme